MIAEQQMTIDDFDIWKVSDPSTIQVRRIERESREEAKRTKHPSLRMAYEHLAKRCAEYPSDCPQDEALIRVEILASGQNYIRFFEAHPEYMKSRDKEEIEDDPDGAEDSGAETD